MFLRALAKKYKDDQMDRGITVLGEAFELVALSHQVSLVIDFSSSSEQSGDQGAG